MSRTRRAGDSSGAMTPSEHSAAARSLFSAKSALTPALSKKETSVRSTQTCVGGGSPLVSAERTSAERSSALDIST